MCHLCLLRAPLVLFWLGAMAGAGEPAEFDRRASQSKLAASADSCGGAGSGGNGLTRRSSMPSRHQRTLSAADGEMISAARSFGAMMRARSYGVSSA